MTKAAATTPLKLVPSLPAKKPLIWTDEVIHEMIRTRPAAVKQALCTIVRDGVASDADRPYVEHVVRWLLADKKREMDRDMLARCMTIVQCYTQYLTNEANKGERRPALEKGPEAAFPLAMGFTVVGSKGDLYTVTTGHWYGAPWQGWACTCPDYFYRCRGKGTSCKHILSIAPTAKKASADDE